MKKTASCLLVAAILLLPMTSWAAPSSLSHPTSANWWVRLLTWVAAMTGNSPPGPSGSGGGQTSDGSIIIDPYG